MQCRGWPVLAGLSIGICVEARAIERVEEPGVEVTFQTALDVTDVCPAAMDAWITQEEVGQSGVN